MQSQVDNLTTENVRLREFQAEVKQYRDLLKFANDNPAFTVVGADVIGVGNPNCNPLTTRPGPATAYAPTSSQANPVPIRAT